MRKFTVAAGLLLALGAMGSAMAADYGLSVSGDVHGATGYQFRGADFAKNAPSVGAGVTVTHTSGAFATLTGDTVSFADARTDGGRNFQLLSTLTVGYAQQVGDVKLSGGLVQYDITGHASVPTRAFTEVFAGAEYQGATLKLFHNVAGSDNLVAGESRTDTYAEVGYTYPIGKFSLGADAGFGFYGNKHDDAKDHLAMAQLRVGYDVNKDFGLQLSHQLAHSHDAFGDANSANNQTYLKATYKF